MIEPGVVAYLAAQPAVDALIGARVYPETLPQRPTYPAVTYRLVFGAEGIDHDGPSGLARSRIQFDCWAATYGGAAGLADALTAALRDYPGARIVNVMDVPEPEVALRRRMVEVSVWHQEE